MDVFEAIEDYLARGRQGALATIIKKLGPAPREEGAKMFVGDDGQIFGTVGGGCVEAEVWQAAKIVTRGQSVKSLNYRMDGKMVENEGMICGGNVDVFVEPVHGRYRDVYGGIRATEKGGQHGVVVTLYSHESFKKTLVNKDGSVVGDPLEEKISEQVKTCMSGKRPFIADGVLIEPVVSSSVLYLFGAGHVSEYVARVAAMVGFTIVVIDDRSDFANAERFPEATHIYAEDFQTVLSRLEFHGNEFVAILTRGHKHDALVLEEILKKPTRYVGMIGSRRKTKLILDHLKNKGFKDSALKLVYAPIGISIDAETPEEIAVSIVAQLIEIRKRA